MPLRKGWVPNTFADLPPVEYACTMAAETIPALIAPPPKRDNPLTRSTAGILGLVFLSMMIALCLGSLPWTMSRTGSAATTAAAPAGVGVPRFNEGRSELGRLSPSWWPKDEEEFRRLNATVDEKIIERLALAHGVSEREVLMATVGPIARETRREHPTYLLGTDVLGRSLLIRLLTGGGISLVIGIAAALLSVCIGTLYGAVAAYAGGTVDAVMMRIVDILYGLPYILLVVLLAVASDAALDNYITKQGARQAYIHREAVRLAAAEGLPTNRPAIRDMLDADPDLRARLMTEAGERHPPARISDRQRMFFDVGVLLVAIGGVSWLTMARVIRGQVLSLKAQPFMEAARAMGVPWTGQFFRHLLPNILGPIIVYATLTVPQAILQESFLSFLGIGVKPPLPSWGNLAADGLSELNPFKSHWWLLLFPCLLLATTLLALNFVGEGLREAFDPKRARARSGND